MSLCPSIICKFARRIQTIWQSSCYFGKSAACLKKELVRWKLFWNEGRREDKPEDLMDALPYTDEDIFPNIRQLILIGCTTPIGICQAERSFFSFETNKNTLTFKKG